MDGNFNKQDVEESEALQSRPSTKPEKRVRGRLLTYKDSDYCEFVPFQHNAQPQRQMIASTRRSSFYKNEGDKENSYTMHVNVDGKVKDPAAALLEESMKLMKDHLKEEPKINVKKFLIDKDGLKLWRDTKEKKLVVRLEIDASKHKTMMISTVSDNFKEIYKTISNL